MITRILDTVPGARSGRGNLIAALVALAALSQRVELLTVIPEDWRPYVTAAGYIILALAGVGWTPPGGVDGGDPSTRVTQELPAVPPISPTSTREMLERTGTASIALLVLLGLSGCGGARVVSVEPTHAWVEGETEWYGAAHVTPGEPVDGEWSGSGRLDTGATVGLCVDPGRLRRPVCTEATLGLYIEHVVDGATLAICWSAVGGLLEDCRVVPLEGGDDWQGDDEVQR